jgi:hypothetical protein
VSGPGDCADVLARIARGERLDAAGEHHRAACAACAALAEDLARVAGAVTASPPEPPPRLDARVLRAAAPLLARNAQAAEAAQAQLQVRGTLDGRRLARALVPAIALFPLLVVVDVWLLRLVHETLAGVLPRVLSTWVVLSYAALLAALGCLVFGAIPLLVERQGAPFAWKEEHV